GPVGEKHRLVRPRLGLLPFPASLAGRSRGARHGASHGLPMARGLYLVCNPRAAAIATMIASPKSAKVRASIGRSGGGRSERFGPPSHSECTKLPSATR